MSQFLVSPQSWFFLHRIEKSSAKETKRISCGEKLETADEKSLTHSGFYYCCGRRASGDSRDLSLSPVSACALYTGDWVSLVCTASIPFHSCHWFVIFWHLEKFQLGQRKSLFKLCIDFEALKSPIYNRKKDTINVVTSILILKWAWVLWNMFSNFLLLF